MTARTPGTGERMVTLDVSLLGRDYKVACKEGEEAELKDAVALLERRMRMIKDGSRTSSVERIAVMAALNLAHEFQRERAAPSAATATVGPTDGVDLAAARRKIAGMQAAIDQVLPAKDRLL